MHLVSCCVTKSKLVVDALMELGSEVKLDDNDVVLVQCSPPMPPDGGDHNFWASSAHELRQKTRTLKIFCDFNFTSLVIM